MPVLSPSERNSRTVVHVHPDVKTEPVVHVHPSITVKQPDIKVPAPVLHVHPSIKTEPTINVQAAPPKITVEAAPPTIHVDVPGRPTPSWRFDIHRDAEGRISTITATPE